MSDVIRPMPASPAEWRAWRRVDRAKLTMIAITMVAAVATFAVTVIVLTHVDRTTQHVDQTTQAVRDTQTEGSPLLLAIQDQQDDIKHAVDNSLKAAKDAAFISQKLRSCLTPGEKCYEHSQQQQTAIIQQIQVGQACSTGFAGIVDDGDRIVATLHCVAQWYRTHQ